MATQRSDKTPPALPVNAWVKDAIDFAKVSYQSVADELTRRGVGQYDRSKVQKMTVKRGISAEEATAISAITSFPLPLYFNDETPPEKDKTITNRIRDIRRERKLSIEQLADMAGVSRSYLNEIELGKKPANEIRLKQIAAALQVPPSDLLDSRARDRWTEFTDLLQGLSDEDQQRVVHFAEGLSASRDVLMLRPKTRSSAMDISEEFRIRLRAEMEAQGINPAALSLRANMNRRAVTDVLEGRSQSPKLSTAFALAKALGTSIDALCGVAPQISLSPRLVELLAQYDEDDQERLVEAIHALPRAPR